MKVVIFAGGLGSRISEESHLRPKPMIEIGGKPILWHIMKIYQAHGFNEFVICLGYKGDVIKEYFVNYFLHQSDFTIDLATNAIAYHQTERENFKVTLVDTGVDTMTGGRLQRVAPYIQDDTFMLTYGDGVANVDIRALLAYHHSQGKICTMTTIQPKGKFGVVEMDAQGLVTDFVEKPAKDGTWINGGFFVLNRRVFDYLQGNMHGVMWEQDPLKKLQSAGELVAYRHRGFWKSMDILRDKVELEEMWGHDPQWKIW